MVDDKAVAGEQSIRFAARQHPGEGQESYGGRE
jgi:hypothetical protein